MTEVSATRWQEFLLAVQFLTRLPVPRDLPFSDALLIRATRFYPLVGMLVGAIGAVVLFLAAQVWPMPIAVLLSTAATVYATGAFHEDGLADAADGLGGGLTRERSLEIMRDSRIGTYGTVTLGLALALKAGALMSLAPLDAVIALIIGHGASRMAAVQVVHLDAYARDQGAKFVAPTVLPDGYRFALAVTFLLLILAVVWFGLLATLTGVALALLAGWRFRAMFLRKLGGYTGDCLGGMQQVTELTFYLGIAAWL